MPPPGRGGSTRTRRQELVPLLGWVPLPTSGNREAFAPPARGKKGGGRVGEMPQQSHQFLPPIQLGTVPGAVGLAGRARDFHPLAGSLRSAQESILAGGFGARSPLRHRPCSHAAPDHPGPWHSSRLRPPGPPAQTAALARDESGWPQPPAEVSEGCRLGPLGRGEEQGITVATLEVAS